MCDVPLGARLAGLRRRAGKSQQLAADFCGISQAALSRYESGERVPDVMVLLRLCAFYGAAVEAVVGVGLENSPPGRAAC